MKPNNTKCLVSLYIYCGNTYHDILFIWNIVMERAMSFVKIILMNRLHSYRHCSNSISHRSTITLFSITIE